MTTAVKSPVGAAIESASVMPCGIATAVSRNIVLEGTRRIQERSYVNIWGISSQGLAVAPALANPSDSDGNGRDQNADVDISEHDLVAGATTAAAAASARKPAGGLCRCIVCGAIAGAENGELYGVSLARAFRAANLLLLVQHDFLEGRLAIFTNVFIDWHFQTSRYSLAL